MSLHWPGRHRGVTLAEVLATVAIMAVVIPVAMQGISVATGLAGLTRQRAEATALAQSKLNELVVLGEWQTANLSGDFGDAWPDYRWKADVSNWEEADMEQLDVVVSWTSRRGPRQIVLSTLVYTGQGGTQ